MVVDNQQNGLLNLPENQDSFTSKTLSEFTLNRIAIIQSKVAKLSMLEMESMKHGVSLKNKQRGNLNRNR